MFAKNLTLEFLILTNDNECQVRVSKFLLINLLTLKKREDLSSSYF